MNIILNLLQFCGIVIVGTIAGVITIIGTGTLILVFSCVLEWFKNNNKNDEQKEE